MLADCGNFIANSVPNIYGYNIPQVGEINVDNFPHAILTHFKVHS